MHYYFLHTSTVWTTLWYFLKDICETFMQFLSCIVQEVFVQCSCVSCHCGRQCTVVQRRICYFSIRDLQAHKIVVFINFRCETIMKRVTCCSMWIDISEELWFRSWILTIPVQVTYSSIIFTGQSDFFSHRFKCLVFQRCYWLCKCLLCKTTIKLFLSNLPKTFILYYSIL